MVFLYPSFLWALTAVLIPVIIHLFNFRKYKKVYFSNVRFLKELQMETKSRSRLKEILVLTARCLAVAALVLAFARPFITEPGDPGRRNGAATVSIYIDNSFSMENVGRQGPLLEVAKSRARDLVQAFGESGRFHIVTNDFEGSEQRFRTRDDAADYIGSIRVSAVPRQISSAYQRQVAFLRNSRSDNQRVFIISDAQKSTFDLADLRPDTGLRISILPLAAGKVKNIYADSCWFDAPVQQKGIRQRLNATVVNLGTGNVEAGSARLFLNGSQAALSTFSVRAGGTSTISFSFSQIASGFNYGHIEIEDYPVTFDDKLFYAFNARLHIGVVLINGRHEPASNAFAALFENDSTFSLRKFSEQAIDYSSFGNADLIVLNQLSEISSGLLGELQKFASAGGGIVVVPPAALPGSYAQALPAMGLPGLAGQDSSSLSTASLDLSSGFYSGVFEKMESRVSLPVVNTHYRLAPGPGDYDPILKLDNGDDLLLSARFRNAGVYLFTSPLLGRYSNFGRHALFVPTLFRMALGSVAQAPAYYLLHPEVVISLRPGARDAEEPPHIVGVDGQTDIIPGKRLVNNRMLLFPRSQLGKPGYYVVRHRGEDILPLAFNYSRLESDLTCYEASELAAMIGVNGWKNVTLLEEGSAGQGPETLMGAEGRQLWKLFIILALVFFLAEVLLLRFFK